ncbi:MAG: nucleic acid-binding protein [Desulfobacteraceae bacterium IS3]|nr:MAG: nucleic acid-binding protein [Desulfobacteraceae bacterium IS3]
MRTIFIDTLYWIAIINPKDQWHQKAVEVKLVSEPFQSVTTESVLIEVANFFCAYGSGIRKTVADVLGEILKNPYVETVPHTRETLVSGLAFYKARSDKGYSLTDCISINVMRNYGLTEVLTHDRHFTQEGFDVLL